MSDIPETIISKGPQKKVASAPAKEKTALPQTIGKYKVISVIAKGGMGTVYKVLHPGLKKEIILIFSADISATFSAQTSGTRFQTLFFLRGTYIFSCNFKI